MNITVLDGYALNPGDLSWNEFEKVGNLKIYDRTPPSQVFERAKDSEVLLTNKTILDGETIRSLPKLKYIGVLATGVNVVDIEVARENNIVVTNIPAYSSMSVAQHVFALLLSVTNRSEHYSEEVKAGKWSQSHDFTFRDTMLIELAGKNFGIIGMGNIGKAVAKIANAFEINVLAYSSKTTSELPESVNKVSLDELYQQCDIISLHCPLTPATKDLINKESIAKMKTGVILINTSRGPIVNEYDVASSLYEGKIGAFCTDVLSTEPPDINNPILSAPNTYITPHIAWATNEARLRLMEIAVLNLKSFINGNSINVVN